MTRSLENTPCGLRALVVAAGFVAALVLPPHARGADEDGYRHGRVRFVESGVTLHRATEVSAEEALANVPFLPGDRVWTDAAGRVEFQFPDGTLVRLDSRSKLDYAGHEEGREERIVLRLWSGSLIARVRTQQAARFEIETPAGSVELLDQAMVRVDVESGETRVSAYRGEAVVDDGRARVRLSAGERTAARWGGAAAEPEAFDISPEDDFASWDEARESEERWASRSSEYLPDELDPYAGELERNGSWRFEAAVGYVWAPRVSAGWSPYGNGHWSWTPYGWTWVPYETWGWAPFHYGRWGFSAGFGWYWAPGRTWGPGWVSWGVGNGYVGWCPLGYRDRPVYAWGGQNRGYAVPRQGGHGGWNVVREGDFGQRDVARRRMPLTGIDPRRAPGRRLAEPATHPQRSLARCVEPDGAGDQPAPDARRLRPRAGGRQQDHDPLDLAAARSRPCRGAGRAGHPGSGRRVAPSGCDGLRLQLRLRLRLRRPGGGRAVVRAAGRLRGTPLRARGSCRQRDAPARHAVAAPRRSRACREPSGREPLVSAARRPTAGGVGRAAEPARFQPPAELGRGRELRRPGALPLVLAAAGRDERVPAAGATRRPAGAGQRAQRAAGAAESRVERRLVAGRLERALRRRAAIEWRPECGRWPARGVAASAGPELAASLSEPTRPGASGTTGSVPVDSYDRLVATRPQARPRRHHRAIASDTP